jgi:hypothetical protein
LKTIQKNETPKQKNEKEKKKKKTKKEEKKWKKNVDIPDSPKFLLDIPYGIMTSCVSEMSSWNKNFGKNSQFLLVMQE